jgi:pimeloyl-ACP methyl ester carboxylesterase
VTVRLISDRELTRLEVLRDLDQRRLTTEAAAQLLDLERRQVFRLLKAYRSDGPTGLISKQRGRPSNRRKRVALDRYTLHPIGIYENPVKLDSFWNQQWPATVIWCRRAVNPGEAHQRRAANKLNAQWHELDTGHYPMLSMPDELTTLLTAGAG